MVIIYKDTITHAYYWACPYCSYDMEFWETMPPVWCPKCKEFLPFNPLSLIDDVEARAEYFYQSEPYHLEVY